MLLALAGYIDVICARRILESVSKLRIREYVCHKHVAQAAQYLLAEMALLETALRFFDDPSSPGLHAYMALADIPRGIAEELNRSAEGAVTVAIRDVGNFLNDALKRYYGSNIWPVTEESSDEYMPDDESVPNTTTTASLGETDAALLGQYLFVQGRRLLELFQFCPRYGHRLPGVRLKAVGTDAVVSFICKEGYASVPMQWESQDRTVHHTRERVFKGNVEAAVSAITTRLRYPELARWAEQMKLAMFSKTFFWNVFVWTKPAIEA